ncbi:MAG TPA: GAF domain-containing protein [Smithella sp.]|nr:GAF domain-containing protein [Smithella sp.]
MSHKEDVESINTKIAAGFENIEKELTDAKNIAELFEILFAGIEKEFQVPFVWLTLTNTPTATPVIEAIKSSNILKDRLNVIKPGVFNEIILSGLKPVLVNKNINQYYKLLPPNRKYFVKSLAVVPFKMNNEIVGSFNNGDARLNRYTPDMQTNLLQKLAHLVSVRLNELI